MEPGTLYGASSIFISLAWMAVGVLTLAVAFLAFQASRKPGLAALRFSAMGFALLGVAAVAGPIVGWILNMVVQQLGPEFWFWLAILKGLLGAAIDAVGIAAVGWGLWQVQKAS